jgi:SPW repeat
MKTTRTLRQTLPIPDRRLVAGGAVILWIAVSPWVWGFAGSHAAVANHVAIVFSFGPLALLIVNLRPAAFVTLLGGIWLVVSPWVLGYATDHTAWLNELTSGVLLIVLCADAAGARALIRMRRKQAPGQTTAASVVAQAAGSRP